MLDGGAGRDADSLNRVDAILQRQTDINPTSSASAGMRDAHQPSSACVPPCPHSWARADGAREWSLSPRRRPPSTNTHTSPPAGTPTLPGTACVSGQAGVVVRDASEDSAEIRRLHRAEGMSIKGDLTASGDRPEHRAAGCGQ